MATETLNINGWDSGWPSGSVAAVDEAVASADGATVSTTIEDDTVIFDLTNTALTDADTITDVSITVRAKKTGTGAASFEVALLIGGSSQGIDGTAPFLSTSFVNDVYTNTGWNSDWTAAQLNGAQVRVVAINALLVVDSWVIDCIDVVITYTPSAPEPAVETLALTGKVPTLLHEAYRAPAVDTLALSGQAPTVRRGTGRYPATDALALTGQAPQLGFQNQALPSADSLAFNAQLPLAVVNHVATPAARALILAVPTPLSIVRVYRSPTIDAVVLAGQVPTAATTEGIVVTPGTLGLALIAEAPLLSTVNNTPVGPGVGQLNVTTYVPPIVQQTHRTLEMTRSTAALLGYAPALSGSFIMYPAAGTLAFTYSQAPIVRGEVVPVGVGGVSLSANTPELHSQFGRLTLSTYAPTLLTNHIAYPAVVALSLNEKGVVIENASIACVEGLLTINGQAPTMAFSSFLSPGTPELVNLTVDRGIEIIATPTINLVD